MNNLNLVEINQTDDEFLEKECVVELKNVKLEYENNKEKMNALDNINLKLYKNEFICVLGPSGCGKTSLLSVIAGYKQDISGEVIVNGKVHTKPNADVGVVFQQPNIFPWLTVFQNIEFGLKMNSIEKKERKKITEHYIELVGLKDCKNYYPNQLSGGMKQRAAIARTLAVDSKIVLLDEPFSALDALTKESMQKSIKAIWNKTEKCFFFITHDVEEAILLSTRIIVMNGNPGRIVSDIENPLRSNNENFKNIRKSAQFETLRDRLIQLIQGGK